MRISNMIRKYVPFNSFRVSGHVVYLKISQSRYMCIANNNKRASHHNNVLLFVGSQK